MKILKFEHPAYKEEDLEIQSPKEMDEAKREAGVTTHEEAMRRLAEIESGLDEEKQNFEKKLTKITDEKLKDILQTVSHKYFNDRLKDVKVSFSKNNWPKLLAKNDYKNYHIILSRSLNNEKLIKYIIYHMSLHLKQMADGLPFIHDSEFYTEESKFYNEVPFKEIEELLNGRRIDHYGRTY